MEYISIFFLGFFIKIVTGIDDMLTRLPVITAITKTRTGKIAFSSGAVTAVATATAIAYFFSSLIDQLPYYRQIVATLLFILSFCIYFEVFVEKPKTKAEVKIKKMQKISLERFTQLFAIGFVASFATVLDDVIAFFPVFLAEKHLILIGIAGILTATLLQASLVICCSEMLSKIPHKKDIAAAGLLILAIGILKGVI